MKKVGILTINDYNNYGNRLQNYAVQQVLKSLGCEVETVVNQSIYKSDYRNLSFMQKLKKNTPSVVIKKIANRLKYNRAELNKLKNERVNNFRNFTAAHIKETSFVITETSIPAGLAENYDYFVTGSDQVWNPNYREGSFIDFLTFAPKNKRVAFSPSFGISQIPDEYVSSYTTWLTEMQSLSVREDAGAAIVKKLTGRDVPVLVDPTLMLTKDDWLKVSKVPAAKPKKKYILSYFLGGMPAEVKSYIEKIAQDHDMEIVHLVDPDNPGAYTAAPDEFIGYVDEASLICTNSFHSAVFSILFSRPFIVFERVVAGSAGTMNSRIDTLLGKFGLQSRAASKVKISGDIFDANYDHVDAILSKEREKVRQYLTTALNS